MKATIFEDDIQAYDDLIQQSQEYMISNPTIRTVDEKYQSKAGEFQMTFNNRTIIQPTGSSSASGPDYHTISTIPRVASPYERYGIWTLLLLTYLPHLQLFAIIMLFCLVHKYNHLYLIF